MRMRSLGVWMFVGALAGLACSDDRPDEEEGVACTLDFRPSVLVTVLDGDTVVDDAVVEYSVDGEATQPCDALGSLYSCGGERAGDFLITAARSGQSGSVAVTVDEDVCHVITEEVAIFLEDEN